MSDSDEFRGGIILLTSCQTRAARAMARLTIQQLSDACGVPVRTLKRIESQYGIPNVQLDSLLKIQRYFEGRGMTFIPETGDARGPGVCWGDYPGRTLAP